MFYLPLVITLFAFIDARQSTDISQAKFFHEYPNALDSLKRFYSHSEIHASLRRKTAQPKPASKETEIAIKRHGSLFKGSWTKWNTDDQGRKEFAVEYVFAFGKKARFQLAKDSSGRGYGLSKLVSGQIPVARNPTDDVYTKYNVAIGRYALIPYQVDFFFVENLLNKSAFKITQCTTTKDQGEQVFRIGFISTGRGAGSIFGFVELLPERKWVARRYSVKTVALARGVKDATKTRQHDCLIDYKLVDDFPVPVKAEYKDGLGSIICDYQSVRSESEEASDESEYDLSYFGIPDYLAKPGGRPNELGFYALSASAIFAMVLAAILWRRSRWSARSS